MTKIIHISDLHLCDEFSKSIIDASEFRESQWQVMSNVVLYANKNNVDFILISGDVYERNYFTKNHAKRFINILSNFKGYVLIISGNHDYIGDEFPFDDICMPENIIYHISNSVRRYDFDKHNLSIFMHSWEKSLEFSPDLKNLDTKNVNNILMLHSGTIVDKEKMPIKDEDILRDIDYVALGHIHKPMAFDRFYYPGSLQPLNIKETGSHGGYLIEIENDVIIKFVDFATVEYFDEQLDVTDMTIDEVTQELSELKNNKTSILRLKLLGNAINFDEKELEYALKRVFDYAQVLDMRDVSFDLSGIDNKFLEEVDRILEEQYSGEYKADLKRKIYSLISRTNIL